MRVISFAILIALFGLASGCTHKPEYSNINTDRPRASEDTNAAETPTPPPNPAPAPSPNPTDAGQTAATPAAPEANKVILPPFLDQTTGAAKDLPNYPKSHRINFQAGQISGSDTMSLILRTQDSMDEIASFYETAIKKNGWTVTDKTRDPEMSEWTLAKGDRDAGKVHVQRDPRTGLLDIVIVRTQVIEQSKK